MGTKREELETRRALLVAALHDGVGREERLRLRAQIAQVCKELEAESEKKPSADGEEDGMVLGFQYAREFGADGRALEPATADGQPDAGWTEEVVDSVAAVNARGGQLLEDAHHAAIERMNGGL
ncbi:GCN5-related N-acetyltransferase [Burkholderiales bacterium GJ-E10]|nr:GCN5-related N-acetyltransferase [Burkholderiales bacterium GJ-E10]